MLRATPLICAVFLLLLGTHTGASELDKLADEYAAQKRYLCISVMTKAVLICAGRIWGCESVLPYAASYESQIESQSMESYQSYRAEESSIPDHSLFVEQVGWAVWKALIEESEGAGKPFKDFAEGCGYVAKSSAAAP
jgi:hypothetical protein